MEQEFGLYLIERPGGCLQNSSPHMNLTVEEVQPLVENAH